MEMQKLTVHNYSDNENPDTRVTLSVMNIVAVMAGTEDVVVNGRSLRRVDVIFMDGNGMGLILNHADMSLVEKAVGSFCLA